LDFLGFPWILSSESILINGLRGISRQENVSRLSPRLSGAARQKLAAEAIRKRGLAHEASLTWLLIFCKELLALIAITVDGPASAVMAGLVPAIHAVRLRHRFTGPDRPLSSIY
jgi:hypothetical protein